MKKTTRKNLLLAKQTIRELKSKELVPVAGGLNDTNNQTAYGYSCKGCSPPPPE